MLNFGFNTKVRLVRQAEASDCGLACIAMVATFHGYATDLRELRAKYSTSLKGSTLEGLMGIFDHLKMTTRGVKLEIGELRNLQLPAILHWNLNHFVVLSKIEPKFFTIFDPARGEMRLREHEVSEHFTGIALEVSPGFSFTRKAAAAPIGLRHLLGKVVGLKRGLLQIFCMALLMEAFALITPLFMQWITDEAIVSENASLLTILCVGMASVAIINTTIGAVRAWVGLYLSTNFNLQWMANVMSHLLKLPVEYFERRHIGDIVSRFQSIQAIERTITQSTIDVLLDGILVIGTFLMMFAYSKSLTLVALLSVLLYGTLRFLRYDREKNAETGIIAKHSGEQTYFLETIRGVRTIKMLNRSSQRHHQWLQMYVETVNAGLILKRLSLLFSTSWNYLSGMERAAIFWIGATAVIDGKMSLGMLFAFITYKEQFSTRINRLIDRYVEFNMLDVSLERLADIVLTEPEEDQALEYRTLTDDNTLAIVGLVFRYSPDEPILLNVPNFSIRHGECIAIVGASGCGKTTLLKVLQGILPPAVGDVMIGGISIKKVGLQNYRGIIASVMQDDSLFAGSIYDNIAFLDASPNVEWIIECAKAAHIHNEIQDFVMGYHTLVGDMGTVLSGGQKQRILLARALYFRPQILFLDEATSHLDLDNECKIGEAIAKLNITRIMVAHRPQTIEIADRVFLLHKGLLTSCTPRLKDGAYDSP